MNQPCGSDFARVYNLLWADFAYSVAPRIYDFYMRQPDADLSLLDVCCASWRPNKRNGMIDNCGI